MSLRSKVLPDCSIILPVDVGGRVKEKRSESALSNQSPLNIVGFVLQTVGLRCKILILYSYS